MSARPPATREQASRFRVRLLVAMMLVISAVTGLALYVAQNQLESGEEQALESEFRGHLGYVRGLQETWHAAIADRCGQAAKSVRIGVALEDNDAKTAYEVAEEFELRGIFEKPGETVARAPRAKFFRFLDAKGQLLAKPGVQPEPWEAGLALPGGLPEEQTLSYIPGEIGGVPTIFEILTTPVVVAATGEVTGAILLGFEPTFAGASAGQRALTSGIWFDGRLYFPGARNSRASDLNGAAVGRAIASQSAGTSVKVPVGGVPHLLFFNRLDRGVAQHPAYHVCLYSLADSLARLSGLRWQILGVGGLVLLAGLLASHFLSSRFSAPVKKLAEDSAQNLAQRERAEAALVLTEQKYRSIYENAVEGIYLLSPDGRFLSANPALARIYGYPSAAALCQAFTDPNRIFVEPDRNAELLRLAGEPGGVSDFESEVLRADGRKIWVAQNARAIRDAQGNIAHYEGTLEDISERKRAGDALLVLNGELEKALSDLKDTQQQIIQQERLRALGQMASGIAHDFNNALVPILGFCELLQHNPATLKDTAKTLRYLNLIETAAKDATSVVGRLREFYRSKDHKEAFRPVDLAKLMTQIVTLTQPKWKDQAQANGATVEVVTQLEALPPLAGDESALREVLTNLVFNAVDAMSKGGTITLRTYRLGASAVIEVADTGTGMTEEVRARCLEPFFSTKGERGTGLGLSMAFGIIRRHSGLMDIRSAPGKGTTFVITLPLHQVAMDETNGVAAPARAALRPLRVLVVDDEPQVRELLEAALTSDGHTVELAAHGADGLRRFLDGQFDLIITDKAMPGMSGDQLASAIKEIAPKVPIILLTGFGQFLDPQEYPKVDVLAAKPISLPALRDAMATALQAK